MSEPTELSWSDVLRTRLAAHRLTDPAPAAELARVVGDVCGIHAQVMVSAELSLGLRVEDATRSTVQAALWTDRSLVKTYGLRGTVHVFPADELELWLTALQALPPPERAVRGRLEVLGLTRLEAGRIRDEIGGAVEGRRLTLAELEAAVGERLGPHVTVRRGSAFGSGQSLVRSFLGDAALAGTLCFGPNDGNRVTFVRPSDWLGPLDPVDEREALATVVRRYLRAYGPATVADFRQWMATTTERARTAFETVGDELVRVRVEGQRAWWLPEALDAIVGGGTPRGGEPAVQLLGHFDVYCVGSRPRDELVPPAVQAVGAERGLTRASLHANVPVLVVDGRVAGLWRREVTAKAVEIRVEPIGQPLTASLRAGIEGAAERVGRVLEREPTLAFGQVEARPHM